MTELHLETTSARETRDLGRRLGRALPARAIVFLEGELGSGKTQLAKGLYEGFGGLDPDHVTSPSYTVVNVYDDLSPPCYHVDLYRLEDGRQLEALEYEDFFYRESGLTIVEWPRRAPELLDEEEYLRIAIERGADDEIRSFRIEGRGAEWNRVLEEFRAQ